MGYVRFLVFHFLGKIIFYFTRLLGRGGGTAAPGLWAERWAPDILSFYTRQLTHGSIIVSGTNGKTTTARILADSLKRGGYRVVHNRSGSNLIRGLISACITHSSLFGRIKGDIGLWEVDEAVVPLAIKLIKPKVVVLNNLFRDQLDRYGEVNTVAALWKKGIEEYLPHKSALILNADDPSVAHLGHYFKGAVYYYGIEDRRHAVTKQSNVADSSFCFSCATPFAYEAIFMAHVGHYRCHKCGASRPAPHFSAHDVTMHGATEITFQFYSKDSRELMELPVGGFFNVYNAMAALSAGTLLGFSADILREALLKYKSAFGRFEILSLSETRKIALLLAKNPTGFNEALRTVLHDPTPKRLMIVINDRLADSTDVSWLWDVDFEVLAETTFSLRVSGIRAFDMGLRLLYAGVDKHRVSVSPDLSQSLTSALGHLGHGETLYIIPTYTALLELKTLLSQKGIGSHWQKD